MNEKQLEYVIFCIENLAERCGKTGAEMHALLKKSALLRSIRKASSISWTTFLLL